MWRVTLGLLLLSLTFGAAFAVHALATGITVPYPDPTPEQAAHERYHNALSTPLFLAAGASFGACLICGAVAVLLGGARRKRVSQGSCFPDQP